MEITNELLAAAFAAYIPCKAILDDCDAYMTGVDFAHEIAYYTNMAQETDVHWTELDKCKLQLHRLSDITDEHAIEVAELFGEGIEDWGMAHCIKYGKKIAKGIGYMPSPYLDKYMTLTDKLREWGYATKFRGIDLIESGIAEYVK